MCYAVVHTKILIPVRNVFHGMLEREDSANDEAVLIDLTAKLNE